MLAAVVLALDVMLVYPGAAGSAQEAEGFLQSLGRFIDKKAGFPLGTVKVGYENDLQAGVAVLRAGDGRVAAASMPALCAAGRLRHRYVCSPLVAGRAAESVSIMARVAGKGTLEELRGRRLAGTLLSFPAYVDALVLGGKLALGADFVLVPKPTALLAVKALREGEADAIMLSQSQVEALAGVVQAGTMVEAWQSSPIPTAPVIALGDVSAADVEKIKRAFLQMCADPEGAELCDTMGVAGFESDHETAVTAALETCWGSGAAGDKR